MTGYKAYVWWIFGRFQNTNMYSDKIRKCIFSAYKRRMNEDDFNDIGRILKYFKQHLDQHTHFLKQMTNHR